MRYTIKVRSTTDPLFLPWDIHVAGEGRFPRVQEPHPYAGDKLMGFEHEPQACEVLLGSDGWQEKAIGMSPVLMDVETNLYSIPTYKITEIIAHEEGE